MHLNVILHSIRVSQGLCLGWPGAKCILMVCQHHAGSVETQAQDDAVSEAHPQHPAASSSSPRATWRPHGSQTFQPCTPRTHSVQGQGGTGCRPRQTRGARQPAGNKQRKESLPTVCHSDLSWALGAHEVREGPELRSLHRATSGVCPVLASPGLLQWLIYE